MKKSARDKRKQRQAETIESRKQEILESLREAFEEKFGRPPGPNDPLFFDPNADEPQNLSLEKFDKDVLEAMKASGVPPQIIYAFKKTGRLLSADLIATYPPESVLEWEAAIDEYFAMEDSPQHSDTRSTPEIDASEIERDDGIAASSATFADALNLTGSDRERYIHSHKHPPFVGFYELKIGFELLGKKVQRDARIKFELVPGWPYFDPVKQEIFEGWESSNMSIEVLVKPFYGSREERKPVWAPVDLFEEGLFSKAIWEAIDDTLDEHCREIDRERRKAAGLPVE